MSDLPNISSLFDLSGRTAVVGGAPPRPGPPHAAGEAGSVGGGGARVVCGDLNTAGAQ